MINEALVIFAYAMLADGIFFAMLFVYRGMTQHLRKR